MTTTVPSPTVPSSDRRVVPFTASGTSRYGTREREFGVGYGKSSGYASPRRYAAAPWGGQRFRVV